MLCIEREERIGRVQIKTAKTGNKSRNVLPGPGSDTGETPAVANTCRAGVYLISATFQLVCAHGIGVHE